MNNRNNFDPAEIEKFTEHASNWWDLNGDFKPLHDINPLRLGYINEKAPLTGKKVIDIGCGGGILSESMAVLGADVTGVDMSAAALDVARLHLFESGLKIEYLLTTAEAVAEERPQQYDIVTCLELLEHVPDPVSVVRACATLVKPGGHVFFSTLNRNFKAYLFAVIGAEYILKLLPKHTHDYAKFIQPAELAKWSRQNRLTVENITGLTYNPVSKIYKLSADTSVNYLMHLTYQG
jgi:2-polyprenyl-6-hydroxyphenyl methylase/3-demethylubiquinone-9 3-methyltransferase